VKGRRGGREWRGRGRRGAGEERGGHRCRIRPCPPIVLVVSLSPGPSSSPSPYPHCRTCGPRPCCRPRILIVRCVVPIPPSSLRASSHPLPRGSRCVPVLVLPVASPSSWFCRIPVLLIIVVMASVILCSSSPSLSPCCHIRPHSPHLPSLSASLTSQSLVLVVIHVIPGPRGVLISCRRPVIVVVPPAHGCGLGPCPIYRVSGAGKYMRYLPDSPSPPR
jgi:hypothetical protein